MTDGSNTPIRHPATPPSGGPGSTVSTRSRDEIEKDIHERREQSGRSGDSANPSTGSTPDTKDIRDRTRHEAEAHRARHLGEPAPSRRLASDDREKSAAELEREVEHERAQLTRTLDEIRGKLSLGQMVDQAVHYAKESGGGEFTRNLGRSVRDNPLPVAFIGAGIGWHLLASRTDHDGTHRDGAHRSDGRYGTGYGQSTHGGNGEGTLSSVKDRAAAMGSHLSEEASHAKGALSGAVSSARDWASSARNSTDHARHDLSDRAHDVSHRASEMAGDARNRIQEAGTRARHGWSRMAEDQPLVLGAIGLAAGAAIAAMFPSTRTENRVMGESSDTVKDEAKAAAAHELDHVKTVAEETTRDATNEFKSRGITPESAKEATSAAAKKVEEGARRVAHDSKSDIDDSVDASRRNSGSGGTQTEPTRDQPANTATPPNRPGAPPGIQGGQTDGQGGGKKTNR